MATIASETLTIDIAAPPEKVWQLITTASSIPSWYDGWSGVTDLPEGGQLVLGSTFRLVDDQESAGRSAFCRVVEVEPLVKLVWVESQPNEFPTTVVFSIWSTDRLTSKLTLTKQTDVIDVSE